MCYIKESIYTEYVIISTGFMNFVVIYSITKIKLQTPILLQKNMAEQIEITKIKTTNNLHSQNLNPVKIIMHTIPLFGALVNILGHL